MVHGVKVHAGICDLADKDAIAAYIAAAAKSLGGVISWSTMHPGSAPSDDEEGWTRSIDIDVMATVRASRAAIPLIEKAGGGANLEHFLDLGLSREQPYRTLRSSEGGGD